MQNSNCHSKFLLVLVLGLTVSCFFAIETVRAEDLVILNPSLENGVDSGQPLDWQASGYGENRVSYEYVLDDGHDGDRSVKVVMQDRVSGDGKWEFKPLPVEGGKDYMFSAWYKSNVSPSVVAEYTYADGKVLHFGMPKASPSEDEWRHYTNAFTTPEGAIAITIYFFLKEDGWVQTDDYDISSFTHEGFARPIVTLTFDDGAKNNVKTVIPLLDRLGFESTHCYMTEPVEGNSRAIRRLLQFYNNGHEMCSHSVSHPDLTTLSEEELKYELTHSRAYLEKITDDQVPNIATPFGAYDERVLDEIKKYYYLHRTVDSGYNAVNNFDPYRLKVQNMLIDTSLEEFQGWVNKAIEEDLWLILVYHKVGNEHIRDYDTYHEDFIEQMEWLKSTGVTVLRLDEAFQEVLPQTGVKHDPVLEDVTERGIKFTLQSWWKRIKYFLTHP